MLRVLSSETWSKRFQSYLHIKRFNDLAQLVTCCQLIQLVDEQAPEKKHRMGMALIEMYILEKSPHEGKSRTE